MIYSRLSCTLVGWLICKGLPLLTRSSSPKKCENLNLRAPRAPNHTKVPSCADFTGRMAELYAPFWGASCLLSRPEGRVAAPHPPGKGRCAPGENSDNKSKPLIWGAWGGRISLFVCFMPQQRRGGRIRPGSRGTFPRCAWKRSGHTSLHFSAGTG